MHDYKTTIYLDDDVKEKLDILCKQHRRSKNNLITTLIEDRYGLEKDNLNNWSEDAINMSGIYDNENIRDLAYDE